MSLMTTGSNPKSLTGTKKKKQSYVKKAKILKAAPKRKKTY